MLIFLSLSLTLFDISECASPLIPELSNVTAAIGVPLYAAVFDYEFLVQYTPEYIDLIASQCIESVTATYISSVGNTATWESLGKGYSTTYPNAVAYILTGTPTHLGTDRVEVTGTNQFGMSTTAVFYVEVKELRKSCLLFGTVCSWY